METIFRKYRTKQGEVWQLGRHEAPFWALPEEGGQLFRPRRAVCLSLRTAREKLSPASPDEPGLEAYLGVVTEAARAWKLRPERIEVAGAWLAEALGARLAVEKVPVVVCEGVPTLTALFKEWDHLILDDQPPGALSVPGVTVERIAAFARAAALFAEAAPWRHLTDVMDILDFEAEGLPSELQRARLLGAHSSPGILFQPDEPGEDWYGEDEDWEEAEPQGRDDEILDTEEGRWQVRLCPPGETPAEDVELWMEHGLPLANPTAYPVAVWVQFWEPSKRPDATLLSWFEAILTALASTTEEEMDSGRWEKEVVAFDRPVRLGLSLSDVLKPAYADELTEEGGGSLSPEDLADELVTEAVEAWGRRQIHLAGRAIALWPDCIDAWLVLARRALDREAARDLYGKAVAAGERLLHEDRDLGYVLACIGFARTHWDLGARDEAVVHFQKALAVDPSDHERVRFLLAYALLGQDRLDEAEDLLNWKREDSADWHYTRALLVFRQEGDSPAARRQVTFAKNADRSMAKRLLGVSEHVPFSRLAPEEDDTPFFQEVWASTPGALEWLRAENAGLSAQARKNKKKSRKRLR
jgi:tetratricopeptide (TPR) repeat protein